MNYIKSILIITALFIPWVSFAHEHHDREYFRENRWQEENRSSRYYYDDDYGYADDYERDYSNRGQKKRHHKNKHYSSKQVQLGWDIAPGIAKHASNCYRYKLSANGGKGSARITSIPGKNYIQVNGTKSGYVCFQGEPTLELGKLGDPGINVSFKLESKGRYTFNRGQKGSNYKNHWYRSYWGL